jgi:plasmid stability protein
MTPGDDGMIMVSFMAPRETADALTTRAAREGVSRSALIRELLDAGLRGRLDPGLEMQRLRQEVERLSGLVEKALAPRRKR